MTLFTLVSIKYITKLQSLLNLFLLTFMFGGVARAQFWEPAGLKGGNLRALCDHGEDSLPGRCAASSFPTTTA